MRTSMATLAPTRNARPTVWRIRTKGKTQSDGDSRSQVLNAVDSIQANTGSIAADVTPGLLPECPGAPTPKKKAEPERQTPPIHRHAPPSPACQSPASAVTVRSARRVPPRATHKPRLLQGFSCTRIHESGGLNAVDPEKCIGIRDQGSGIRDQGSQIPDPRLDAPAAKHKDPTQGDPR